MPLYILFLLGASLISTVKPQPLDFQTVEQAYERDYSELTEQERICIDKVELNYQENSWLTRELIIGCKLNPTCEELGDCNLDAIYNSISEGDNAIMFKDLPPELMAQVSFEDVDLGSNFYGLQAEILIKKKFAWITCLDRDASNYECYFSYKKPVLDKHGNW